MFEQLKKQVPVNSKIFWPLIRKILIWTFWDYKSSWSKKPTPIQPRGVIGAPYYVFSKNAILGSVPSISSEVLGLMVGHSFKSHCVIRNGFPPTFGWEIETEFSGLPRVGCRLARITLLCGWDASMLLFLALFLSLKVFTVWTSPKIRKNK